MEIVKEKSIKRKNKIIFILLLVISLFAFVGCDKGGADGKEYSILYVRDGVVLDLQPYTYISGNETSLPVLEDGFIGWYDNRKLEGEAVSSISSDTKGNLIFYAKFEETQVGNNTLSKYIEDLNNYQYTYKYTENEEYEVSEKYYIDQDMVKVIYQDEEGKEYTEFASKENNSLVYYYDNGDGTYDKILENDSDFEDLYYALYLLLFSELNDEDFTFENNCFIAKSEKVNEAAKSLIGDYEGEEFSELKIFIENEKLSKVTAKSTYEYEGSTINCTFEYSLSNHGNVNIVLPNDTKEEKKAVSINVDSSTYTVLKGTSLEDALKAVILKVNYDDGTSESVNEFTYSGEYNKDVASSYSITLKYEDFECNITIVVNELQEEKEIDEFISNMNSYQYVYSYDDDNYGEYEAKVYVSGDISKYEVIDEYNDLYYDYLYTDDEGNLVYLYDNGDGTYDAIKESDADFNDYYLYLDIIDFSNVNNSNYTYSNNCFTAVSNACDQEGKNLLGDYEDEVYESLKIYVNDSYVTKINAISSYISDGKKYYCNYEVVFSNFSSTNITLPNVSGGGSETEKTETSISTSSTNINVLRGTSFDEVLEKIVIKLNYSDGTSEVIDNSECTFSHSYSPSTLASYDVKVIYKDFECTFKINVLEEVDVFEIIDDTTIILEDILDEMNEYEGQVYGITKGLYDNNKVLVIPVEFTDYKADSNMVEALEKAFFGTSEDTGWESLKSYYYKSSYGKCNIDGTVLPVFSTGNTSKYYDSLDDYEAVDSIIKAALEYYDSTVNYDEYDLNGDNYIDSIYLVYTAPIDYQSDDSLYWAFSSQYFTEDYEYYDNVEADFYCFMGYDFLFEELANGNRITYNAETIIHESGHLFGLDDYYDYDDTKGPDGGIGGGDMMDYNVGDHNAFSKIMLGWVKPMVIDANNITSDITIDLESFSKSGDCVVICNGWENSFFDEYYVIDFYTPDGLNSLEAGYGGLFSENGIRIYHVDATLKDPSDAYGVWEVYKYNNSDTSHKLIRLVQADDLEEIEKDNAYSDNNDLFQGKEKFTNIKWYDNTSCKFEIVVNLVSSTSAQITIKYLG